jgi:hypothetical protein
MNVSIKAAATRVVSTVEVVSPAKVVLELTLLEANILGVLIGSTSPYQRNSLMKNYPYDVFNVVGGDAGQFGSQLYCALANLVENYPHQISNVVGE